MKIPDEILSAFLNGELEGPERQRIERAIARDRRVAQRVAKQRALRSRLHAALDDVWHQPCRQPLPARRSTPVSAQIIDLARVRAERAQVKRHRRVLKSPRFVLATGLAIGLAAGMLLARLSGPDALTAYRNGVLTAEGALARALNEQLSGQASPHARIRVIASYRSRYGAYCRSFAVSGPQGLAGIACRNREQWQVQTLLNNAAGPPPLLELNRSIINAPLTAATEAQLRAHDWL
jgi:hypothetical protein